MGRRWNLGERRCIYFLISYVVTLKDGRRSEIKSVPIVAVLADCGLIFAVSSSTLKVLAEQRGIRFGAMYQSVFHGGLYDKIFAEEMNVTTAGTFMVDGGVSHKSRTEFDFSEMDEKVNFGRTHNMEIHGHILVWFDDIADWVKNSPLADVENIMNGRIDAFVKRYAGKIKVWDVVNEAMNDGEDGFNLDDGPAGTLRLSHKWAQAMGADYIRKAFVRAHAADPTAVLRYNEYSMESNEKKFEGGKALLINLKKQNAPVHALGWQMHVKPGSFVPATLLARMNEIADLGFDNYVTELDVELPEKASAADYEKQKQTYKTVVETVLAARRLKTIVVWGLRDGDPDWLTNNHPQLFDESLRKKPAYFGVQEALK